MAHSQAPIHDEAQAMIAWRGNETEFLDTRRGCGSLYLAVAQGVWWLAPRPSFGCHSCSRKGRSSLVPVVPSLAIEGQLGTRLGRKSARLFGRGYLTAALPLPNCSIVTRLVSLPCCTQRALSFLPSCSSLVG